MTRFRKKSMLLLFLFILTGAVFAQDLYRERTIRLPKSKAWEYRYIEETPDPDYRHATPDAFEEFRDMKFGVRIHWGLYSLEGCRIGLDGESWMFHQLNFKQRQEYVDSYQRWNPTAFDADRWMEFFKQSGVRVFAITTKHHEGFSLFDTKTRVKRRVRWDAPGGPKVEDCDLAYSVMETPFKRDIIKELVDAGRRWDLKIDLYFSHPDWYDADFRPYSNHPLITWDWLLHARDYGWGLENLFIRPRLIMTPEPTEEERKRMLDRHRAQLLELATNYGKIDMICLDMNMGPAVFPHFKETIKMVRKLQPQVMFRARGIGNYGDYYTPERYVPGRPSNTDMPWMVIYPLGRSFSYEGEAKKHKGTRWIVTNLIDSCAKGGNFMVGIGPDETGWFHPETIKEMLATGDWLQVNGEAIYGTRMWRHWKEGGSVRFTRAKDGHRVYALLLKWPGEEFRSKVVVPAPGSEVHMLGVDEPLSWRVEDGNLVVDIPRALREERPCDYAWVLRFEQ